MLHDENLRGAPVYDLKGQFGRVVEVARGEDAETLDGLWIALDGEDRPVLIPAEQISAATPERVTLAIGRNQLISGDRTVTIPLHEELLEATTRPVERGKVLIHKTVETEPVERPISVSREDVSVERVPVDRIVDQAPQPRWEGDTLIVPLVEEVLIVEKRLRVHQELRVTRRRVEEKQTVRDDLRREVARIQTRGDTGLDEER